MFFSQYKATNWDFFSFNIEMSIKTGIIKKKQKTKNLCLFLDLQSITSTAYTHFSHDDDNQDEYFCLGNDNVFGAQ